MSSRLRLPAVLAFALVAMVLALPPMPEPPALRALVDERAFFGIANFLNVVSNIPFLLVGLYGLYVLTGKSGNAFVDAAEKRPYAALFLAVALTALGSTYYHLVPEDDTALMWDRLPMSVAFAALFCAVVAERISVAAGLRLLVPLTVIGAATVVYWRWSQNILPYAAVQYGGLAAIVAVAALFRSRYTRGGDLFVAVAIYALAKLAEVLDAQIYALGELVSGHTLKHLIAAAALWWLVRMLKLRFISSSP